jgi:hypothetical protein
VIVAGALVAVWFLSSGLGVAGAVLAVAVTVPAGFIAWQVRPRRPPTPACLTWRRRARLRWHRLRGKR